MKIICFRTSMLAIREISITMFQNDGFMITNRKGNNLDNFAVVMFLVFPRPKFMLVDTDFMLINRTNYIWRSWIDINPPLTQIFPRIRVSIRKI
jgi:hypothetical protein